MAGHFCNQTENFSLIEFKAFRLKRENVQRAINVSLFVERAQAKKTFAWAKNLIIFCGIISIQPFASEGDNREEWEYGVCSMPMCVPILFKHTHTF